MQKIKEICFTLFLLALSFFISAGFVSAAALGPQAANCSWGDYSDPNKIYLTSNGGTHNETQISSALSSLASSGKTSVYLKAGLYLVDGQINMPSGAVLEGDNDAIIKLVDHAGWLHIDNDSLISSNGIVSNIEIKCFSIDGNYNFNDASGGGNYSSNSCWSGINWASSASAYASCEALSAGDRKHGLAYYTLIFFSGGSNFSVHDMSMKDGANDGFKIFNARDIQFYNNFINAMGHEGIYASASHNIDVYGNNIIIRASDGVRGDDCYDYFIHDNEFQSVRVGGVIKDSSAGIQVAPNHSTYPIRNVQIYRNVFHDIWNGGIWLSDAIPKYGSDYPVFIHHNVFTGNGVSHNPAVGRVGGIIARSGAYSLVSNNVFDSNYGAGINANGPGITAINNIIVGSKDGKYAGAGDGAAIYGATDVTYNITYNNVGGNYSATSGNMITDPLFANQAGNDYHLLSMAGRWNPGTASWTSDSQNSPGIDKGLASSDYVHEPAPNGSRINIGRYGNTTQASLSGTTPPASWPPAPSNEPYDLGYSPSSGGGSTSPATPPSPVYSSSFVSTFPSVFSGSFSSPAFSLYSIGSLFGPAGSAPETATQRCTDVPGSAGFIPCGRSIDDPDTGDWDECDPCDLCAMILMGQLVTEFLLKLAAIAATLAITFSGLVYVFAAGRAEVVNKSKMMMKAALIGFVIIFISWVVVDSILATLGYIDPIEGVWYTIC
ncbi:MAG: right-handed parallel beta-helix repeat-containing protein [Candidatus Pacebacteria bacterium]|nr:right-handed parallel beta-helix repeat-containing protein [Candidatus Paceibacterota bacterium]